MRKISCEGEGDGGGCEANQESPDTVDALAPKADRFVPDARLVTFTIVG